MAPFDLRIPAGANYYLVYLPDALSKPKVQAFRDWIVSARSEMPQYASHGAETDATPR